MNATESKPLVSIGLPVYNGERFIRQALDSLLAQDYDNFELIISDNASTDCTSDICRDYLAKNQRIRYYRNEKNLGAVANFNRVFELSSGKYFMWAAADNELSPSFISCCSSILQHDPHVVLAYSRTTLIDDCGNPLGLAPDQIDTRGLTTIQRYKHIIWNLSWCNMIYGLMRRDILGQTGVARNLVGWDHATLAELALKGAFAQVPDPLFHRRINTADNDSEAYKKRILYALDPVNASRKLEVPYPALYRELRDLHMRAVSHAPISFSAKLYLSIETLKCFRARFRVESRILTSLEGMEWFLKRGARFVPRQARHLIRSLLHR
jgi:glycosyltransferase involved in cell wall biosynthesis